jgi:uncharacterized phiE125 gp8 family phage protein
MTARRIIAPAAPAVTLADAKVNLRIDHNDLDMVVLAWIEGVTGYAEHYMGRSIINQTWRVVLDKFPRAIRLDFPPVVSVVSVKFYDDAGALQTLDPQDYYLDKHTQPCYVVPTVGKSWPVTQCRINAVEVEYVAGYGATDADVPEDIRLYLLAKIVELFDPSLNVGGIATVGKPYSFIDNLLDRHKVYEL